MNEIPIYDVVFDSSCNLGITAISLVKSPAIEVDFISLAKQNKNQLIKLGEEKMEIIGPVLIPDKLIYRVDGSGNPYYIKFSKDTIDKLAWNFYINDRCSNVNLEHPTKDANDAFNNLIDGIECVDTWIIEDENDISYSAYKFSTEELPAGTWMMKYKISDHELWNEVKNGKFSGYSVEAFISIANI